MNDPLDERISEVLRSGVLRDVEKDALPNINGLILFCRMFPVQFLEYEPTLVELERKIIDLEQEKRKEKAGYFNDILFLKKELRETLIEKLEEEQKAMILNKPEEEPR